MWRNILPTLACLLCFQADTHGQPQARPPQIKAAFLRNFTHYVTWPERAFASDRSPWRVCVLGDDPFGTVLDDTLRGRTEQGRDFEIVRTDYPGDLSSCQIVFVAYRNSTTRRTLLAELQSRPVLTVGDAPEFLEEGGMIRFQVSDRVELGINLDRTRAVSLKIQTRMLEVAREVVENGVPRRRR
jgi:hypothetical protein